MLSALASTWAEQGNEVTLVVFDDNEAPAYTLHPSVVLRSMGVPNKQAQNPLHALYRNTKRVRLLRRFIRRANPDLVISFLDFPNIITLLATRGLKIPVIVSERTNPHHVELKSVWKFLRRKLYPRAAALVCPTNALAAIFRQEMKMEAYSIPNPVELPATLHTECSDSSKNGLTVTAMGRLAPEKGFDLLLEAFASIAARHSHWSLKIIGAGPLLGKLEAQADSLALQGRVNFVGAMTDPFPVLRTADLFILSSHFEGFPNALAEAMACGLPVISFDCPTGPADIIRHGVDGLLVPPEDVPALAEAMDYLMSNRTEREKLASRAPDVLQRFSLERVLAMWEKVFAGLLRIA